MAEYGYTTKRYVPQENGFDTRKNGYETHPDGWGRTGFASNGEAVRDHVCRPVIIDAQGRRRPLVAYTPENKTDNYFTKTTETIIEQVYPPEVTRYENTSPRKVAPVKEYGVFNNGWRKPVSPDRPPRVDEFISQVQTEASKPSRTTGLVSNLHWRHKPHHNSHNGMLGHGRNGHNDVHQPRHNQEIALEYIQEPAIITEGGWTRPSRAGWAAPTPLTKPTNDIEAAVDYLKEAAMVQSVNVVPPRRFTVPTPMVPRLDPYAPAIDNRDAYRRYGGLGGPQVVNSTADTYSSSAIDSRESARRYHGAQMM